MFQAQRTNGLAGMAWRVGDGRVAWTIGIKTPEGGSAVDAKRRVLDLLEGVQGPPRQWVDETPADGIVRVDLFELPWQERWGAGRVTLIGDAAHAMPTVLGQGACQAIEDGIEVARRLGTADGDIAGALRAYEADRIERVRWVRSQVDRLSRLQRLGNPVLIRLRDLLSGVLAPRVQPGMWRRLLRPPADLASARTTA
jgi:2-polyprenyl-6-methoxyphenol hydroxylase-like FAD-dependent oxidoreductase